MGLFNFLNVELKEGVTTERRNEIIDEIFSLPNIRTAKLMSQADNTMNLIGRMLTVELDSTVEGPRETATICATIEQIEGVRHAEIAPHSRFHIRPPAP
ncbi:MAG TPA: hypothetical protein VIG74_04770 [Alphaproteobacteria bacterium]|jgi:cell division protein FtsX